MLSTTVTGPGPLNPARAAASQQAADLRARARVRRRACTANLDPELRITSADPDFYHQFGRSPSDVCGRSLYELLHPSAPTVFGRHFTRLTERRCNRFAERMVGLKGENGETPFSGELVGIAVHQSDDRLSGIVVMVQPDEEAGEPAATEPLKHRKAILSKLDALVLEGVASGASTVQLASRLYLSRQGVEYHVGLMLRTLKAPNRAALVARAHSMGMLTVGHWPPRVLPEFVK
ncbi:LuxR C-terminal-related transcriptional regulator [Streptomyces sp. SL13]|uniref:LuxR C-terminal-related transcriptional regulator n=1 Tax=Streptantibioticus silvisoli TaxID=2705255 RepID=A0AA90H2V9_9ACTN|nr:LuxR C-terminal-related transcriptional regulator [Streptantibioticus silvisoli]MDI5971031.1 LuxR C-terminal-related transcriptional regulator [Streptantibioticus silvisoli]